MQRCPRPLNRGSISCPNRSAGFGRNWMPCPRSSYSLRRHWPRSSAWHRVSEDFDFFSSAGFDPERLRSRLPFFRDLDPANPDALVHRKRDNLEAFVDRGGAVKVAFFGGLDTLNRVESQTRRAIESSRRIALGFSGHEDAGNAGPRQLEGLCGHPQACVTRHRHTFRSGRCESNRPGFRSCYEYSSPAILRRWNTSSRTSLNAKRPDALGPGGRIGVNCRHSVPRVV
jgi:hypothetical protein